MSNYDKIVILMNEADKLMEKVDASFETMTRGGIINTSRGMTGLTGNLRHANKIFKKLDKLTRAGGDTYGAEEKKAIEDRAQKLTEKYNGYYKLIEQANEIAKGIFGKKK